MLLDSTWGEAGLEPSEPWLRAQHYVEAGARHQADSATVEAPGHPVAVKFDIVQPLVAVRRLTNKLGQLRRDKARRRYDFVVHAPRREMWCERELLPHCAL